MTFSYEQGTPVVRRDSDQTHCCMFAADVRCHDGYKVPRRAFAGTICAVSSHSFRTSRNDILGPSGRKYTQNTREPRSQETAPSRDPTVAYVYGPMGGLGGWVFSYERGNPVSEHLALKQKGSAEMSWLIRFRQRSLTPRRSVDLAKSKDWTRVPMMYCSLTFSSSFLVSSLELSDKSL